jgi:hypothetical protein
MKKHLLSVFAVGLAFTSFAQEVSKTLIGSSYNMYSVLSPSTNPVHANNALGTISFTHRQNADLPGGSGVIQTSYSTDGGSTWDYVLQPTNDETQMNRYPSGLILDPSGNNDLSNAHTVVAGPTTDGSGWVSNYFYNIALDGSGGREFNLNDSDSEFPSFTRNSMMADKNNIVRVLGYNGDTGLQLVLTTGEFDPNGQSYYTDFVYATSISYFSNGEWGTPTGLGQGDTIFYMNNPNPDMYYDGTVDELYTNDIHIISYGMQEDTVLGDTVLVPVDTMVVWNNVAYYQDETEAWNPITFEYDSFYVEMTGAIDSTFIEGTPGYYWTQKGLTSDGLVEFYDYSMAFNQDGDIGYVVHQGVDGNGQIVPFVHHTIDGGANWIQMSHDFSAIDGYTIPAYNGGIDCTVDINGDLHMISSIFEADESIEETNRKVYDIVVNMSGWSAHWIADINTERVLDTDPMAIYGIGYNHRIQAARNTDGSKVFAVWTDVNIEEFGEMEKLEYPDIYAFGKDIQTGMATGVTNFTKYSSLEGSNFWMFTSPIVSETGAMGGYHLPTTISEAGPSELEAMEHFYVNGIHFSEEDFSIENFGLHSANSIGVDAYPNPANSIANIEISLENSADVVVTLVNTLGQEVYSSSNNFRSGINTITLEVKNFEAGMYFDTVSSENFSTTKRLIIK